jgi:SnoaL-like domain
MANPKQVVQSFFVCFGKRKAEGMNALYHPQATFTDPVFGRLDVAQTQAMWALLCARGQDLRLKFDVVESDENFAKVQWQAWYSFGKAKRKVHNRVTSIFEFQDGLIYRQTDTFDFHRWARQALGLPGMLFGWTGLLRQQVRKKALRGLKIKV